MIVWLRGPPPGTPFWCHFGTSTDFLAVVVFMFFCLPTFFLYFCQFRVPFGAPFGMLFGVPGNLENQARTLNAARFSFLGPAYFRPDFWARICCWLFQEVLQFPACKSDNKLWRNCGNAINYNWKPRILPQSRVIPLAFVTFLLQGVALLVPVSQPLLDRSSYTHTAD